MKRLFFLSLIGLLFSCSKNNDGNEPESKTYKVRLEVSSDKGYSDKFSILVNWTLDIVKYGAKEETINTQFIKEGVVDHLAVQRISVTKEYLDLEYDDKLDTIRVKIFIDDKLVRSTSNVSLYNVLLTTAGLAEAE